VRYTDHSAKFTEQKEDLVMEERFSLYDTLFLILMLFLNWDYSLVPQGFPFHIAFYQVLSVLLFGLLFVYFDKIYFPVKILFAYLCIFLSNLLVCVVKGLPLASVFVENSQLIILMFLCLASYNYFLQHNDRSFILRILFIAYVFWIIQGLVSEISYFANFSSFGVTYPDPFFPFPRLTGLNSDPNVFGMYLLTFFPIIFTLTPSHKIRILVFVSTLLLILLTFSRSNTILFFMFTLIYFFLALRFRQISMGEISMYLILSLLIALTIFLTFHEAVLLRIEQLLAETNLESYSRFHLWTDSLSIIARNPLMGIGGEQSIHFLPDHVHNTFLEIYMSYGLLSLPLEFLYFRYLFYHFQVARIKGSKPDLALFGAYLSHIMVLFFVTQILFEPTILLFSLSESLLTQRQSTDQP